MGKNWCWTWGWGEKNGDKKLEVVCLNFFLKKKKAKWRQTSWPALKIVLTGMSQEFFPSFRPFGSSQKKVLFHLWGLTQKDGKNRLNTNETMNKKWKIKIKKSSIILIKPSQELVKYLKFNFKIGIFDFWEGVFFFFFRVFYIFRKKHLKNEKPWISNSGQNFVFSRTYVS